MASLRASIHHEDMTRRPLGDLPVSPQAVDENRDLIFPPWLDVLPIMPHGYGYHGDTTIITQSPAHRPITRHVQIHEDITSYNQQGESPVRPSPDVTLPTYMYNPDTPPKTPENNNCIRANNHGKRKRGDDVDELQTTGGGKEGALFKRPRSVSEALKEASGVSLELHLLSLSPSQLVKLVTGLVESHPELQQEVQHSLPEPDLTGQSQRLSQLIHNIYRALPRSRICSTRGALCYRRVKVHLASFKKFCLQQGRHFVKCRSWKAVMEYTLIAWQHTANLPVWDNPAHNKSRECCFQGLASICMRALKHGHLDKQTLSKFRSRMQAASSANQVMELCIKRLDLRLQHLASL